jgi:hypothetical protein
VKLRRCGVGTLELADYKALRGYPLAILKDGKRAFIHNGEGLGGGCFAAGKHEGSE